MHAIPHGNKISRTIKGGFSRIKPDPVPNNYHKLELSTSIDDKYRLFVLQRMPYMYFATITFARYANMEAYCEHVSRLLKWANNKIFGREYYGKGDFIDGFAFIENHLSGKSISEYHAHLLVKPHYRYNNLTTAGVKDILIKCADKIVTGKNKKVFNPLGLHMETVWNDGAAMYCTKQITMHNVDRIKMLCAHGLSDTLCWCSEAHRSVISR